MVSLAVCAMCIHSLLDLSIVLFITCSLLPNLKIHSELSDPISKYCEFRRDIRYALSLLVLFMLIQPRIDRLLFPVIMSGSSIAFPFESVPPLNSKHPLLTP